MDVPFISSGAISRRHYGIVRNVETAPSEQFANQHLLTEIQSVQRTMEQPNLSLKQCKECLVILLYCSMTVTIDYLEKGAFNFALPHALGLAQAGRTIEDKRIGYLFCAEMMAEGQELKLMLVNTLRKDLESQSIARICLGLDNLIASPNEDVIPAVQSRLHELLSHNYPHIRRRTLLAFRALSIYEPELLTRISAKLTKRIKDPDQSVINAALNLVDNISHNEITKTACKKAVNGLLKTAAKLYETTKDRLVLTMLQSLLILGLSEENLLIVLNMIPVAVKYTDLALLLAIFRLLKHISSNRLISAESELSFSTVGHIRELLTSQEPNHLYTFLSCLECIEPSLWAVASPERAAVLDVWEVERVMQLLESSDGFIRKKTYHILSRIDESIMTKRYAQIFSSLTSQISGDILHNIVRRLLEILEVVCGENGEQYSEQVKTLLNEVDQVQKTEAYLVLEVAVEMVLLHIRSCSADFRMGCVATLLTYMTEQKVFLGPTTIIIVAALAAEYCGRLSIAPPVLLSGFASRLKTCTAVVQDACILSMIRIVADCENVTSDVLESMKQLREVGGRHIRMRCELFLELCDKRHILGAALHTSKSSSLPDFLEALHHQRNAPSAENKDTSYVIPSEKASVGSSRLRYAAYAPPQPTPRLRTRRSSNSQTSITSSRSEMVSDSDKVVETSARIITAGDLALAIGSQEFGQIEKTSAQNYEKSYGASVKEAEAHTDLINLDQQLSDPDELSLDAVWNNLGESSGARGWCNLSVEDVNSRLQLVENHMVKVIPVDMEPYKGEVKILLIPEVPEVDDKNYCVVRLRESEEESCLWRLRCGNVQLRTEIKRLLAED